MCVIAFGYDGKIGFVRAQRYDAEGGALAYVGLLVRLLLVNPASLPANALQLRISFIDVEGGALQISRPFAAV